MDYIVAVRHGKTDDRGDLKNEGNSEMRRLAYSIQEILQEREVSILTSGARRAQSSAEAIGQYLAVSSVIEVRCLWDASDSPYLFTWTERKERLKKHLIGFRERERERELLFVGHERTMETLCDILLQEPSELKGLGFGQDEYLVFDLRREVYRLVSANEWMGIPEMRGRLESDWLLPQ